MTAFCARLLRSVLRDPWIAARNVVGAAFFFVVATAALKTLDFAALGVKSAAVIFPMSALLAASGMSQAALLADDIQRGFFDRLILSSSRRLPMMLGCMLADLVLGAIATVPIVVIALAYGVDFSRGVGGVAVIVVVCATWAAAYGGLWYAVAFRTADPAKARSGFGVFLPLVLFAPSLAPRSAMSGVVAKAFALNPVSYLVGGVRSLEDGWHGGDLIRTAAAIVGIAIVSLFLGWRAVHSRLTSMLGGESVPKPAKEKSAAVSEIDMLREALEAERLARQRAEEKLAGGGQ